MFMNLSCIEIHYKDLHCQKCLLPFKNIITIYWFRMYINICPLKLNYDFLNY